MQARSSAIAGQLNTALANRYVKDDDPPATVEPDAVGALLASVPRESVSLVGLPAALEAAAPGTVLPARERAIIASINDCLKMIFSITQVEPEVDEQLRLAIPDIARHLINAPELALSSEPNILHVMDHLVEATAGWSSDLGKAGDKVFEMLKETIAALSTTDEVTDIESSTRQFLDKDKQRIAKLEERLAASETGKLRSQQSRALAATMINNAMKGKQLTPAIAHFLKGPWFDSAQLVILTKGLESEDWSRIRALTETIIWTYQPLVAEDESKLQQETQRLYRIIEHLPGEIRQLLLALEHDTGGAESALEAIERDHVMLVSGQDLEYEAFEPVPNDSDEGTGATVSRLLLRKLSNYEPGQWFVFRSDNTATRIKLLLKLEDVHQLLFTNRNGIKVMQTGFEAFAYYLSTGVAKPVEARDIFTTTFRTFYQGLIEEHSKQQRRIADRKAEREREAEARNQAREKALREAEELRKQQEREAQDAQAEARSRRLEEASKALDEADPAIIEKVTAAVSDLAVGAWMRLPGPDGKLEDCKLAVRISASDKMIFVGQSGTKIGEYTSDELIRLLVAGQGQIQDEGVEFEDTLQQVVSRLRQDRNKSYDDLTGK